MSTKMTPYSIGIFCDSPMDWVPLSRWSPFGGDRIPHKCPVCEGKGSVPVGFYAPNEALTLSSEQPEVCRSCSGHGIVWK
jgi:hypothetical protein